ncbi:MAG: hypothetical protein EBU46_00085 [Nitrosomonadaceae bacterium]|nr:hypothetical protein [Nitrosomonadaceae bacterium]
MTPKFKPEDYDLRDILAANSMKSTGEPTEFKMDFVSRPFEDVNPNHVLDGPWGGWGNQPTWYRVNVEGERTLNVLELDPKPWCWVRVWDNDQQQWRKPNEVELQQPLPFRPKLRPVDNFDKIVTPIFKKQ